VTRRDWFRLVFLAVTGAAVGLELFATFDGNGDTEPWTDLTVRYLPGEVTAALVGALVLWLPIHFLVRYRRRKAYLREEDQGR
jgi:hypothetical protein